MLGGGSKSGVLAAGFAVGLLLLANIARAADDGEYAPEHIEHTSSHLKWLCLLPAICPVGPEVLAVIKRALAEDPSAEYLLGLTLLTGDGLPADRTAGMAWVARAAEHGDPDAARDIAERLRNGEAIEVDETKIAHALQPEADAGNAEAMRALGPMYIRGRGVQQNAAVGLDLLRRAAAKGSTGAEADLFNIYLNGAPGVPQDLAAAMKWLAASANHGNVPAMLNLGYMAVNGSTEARSPNIALGYCWLMRAALLNQPQAQEKLSMLFIDGAKDDHGTIIDADLVQADLWVRVAARNPYHDNPQIRARIEPNMTTDQLNQAKRLADAWHPLSQKELRIAEIVLPDKTRGACPPMR